MFSIYKRIGASDAFYSFFSIRNLPKTENTEESIENIFPIDGSTVPIDAVFQSIICFHDYWRGILGYNAIFSDLGAFPHAIYLILFIDESHILFEHLLAAFLYKALFHEFNRFLLKNLENDHIILSNLSLKL